MTNIEIVDVFVETLLRDPDLTMEAVRLRLSATDYELVLKRANLQGDLERAWKEPMFPYMTGERSVSTV